MFAFTAAAAAPLSQCILRAALEESPKEMFLGGLKMCMVETGESF